MTKELTKKAVEMLLKGATLLSEPCPYCKGVRVMHDGNALCISCGKEPEEKQILTENTESKEPKNIAILTLEKKLESLSKELEQESDHKKQQDLLKSINSLIETIEKIKNKQ